MYYKKYKLTKSCTVRNRIFSILLDLLHFIKNAIIRYNDQVERFVKAKGIDHILNALTVSTLMAYSVSIYLITLVPNYYCVVITWFSIILYLYNKIKTRYHRVKWWGLVSFSKVLKQKHVKNLIIFLKLYFCYMNKKIIC